MRNPNVEEKSPRITRHGGQAANEREKNFRKQKSSSPFRVFGVFRGQIVVEQTCVYYAAIRTELKASGSPIPANDAWIAALARQHRMPIVSRDVHFDRVRGAERLGWAPA
jgi:predicted nucleic acid-binding protein